MKKDGKRITLDLNPRAFSILNKNAKILNKSRTQYIEDMLLSKMTKNKADSIEKILNLKEEHKSIYIALNSTFSNINQVVHQIYYNQESIETHIIKKILPEIIQSRQIVCETIKLEKTINENLEIFLNNKIKNKNIKGSYKSDDMLKELNKIIEDEGDYDEE